MFGIKMKRNGVKIPAKGTDTSKLPTEAAAIPELLIFPLSMHIGAPAEPVVAVGDRVLKGQLIAEAQGRISAHVHASVSGEVVEIGKKPTQNGPAPCIVIRNDHKDEVQPKPEDWKDAADLDAEGIRERIQAAGLVGMGGATFPTRVKVEPPKGARIDTLIINGAECEPNVSADLRLMNEDVDRLLEGIGYLRRLLPDVRRVFLAVENETYQHIDPLKEALEGGASDIKLVALPTMYPQGAEKTLIRSLTNREVPPGGLPAEVHCLIQNVATVAAIADAVRDGMPLTERIVTVVGNAVKNPRNLRVRIGTPIGDLLKQTETDDNEISRVIGGGPMMGKEVMDLQVPVTKGTNAISILSDAQTAPRGSTPCIMCGECLNVCPVDLQPILIAELSDRGRTEDAKEMGAMDCIECGACTYICPAAIPLLDRIRDARTDIKNAEAAKKEN